jgi:hypothetical protein
MAILGKRGVVFAMLTMPECEQGRTLGGCGGYDTPPAFRNRSKVGPKKCISDNQFGPRTSDILGRYIYVIKIN